MSEREVPAVAASFFQSEEFNAEFGEHTFDTLRRFEPKKRRKRVSTSVKLDADLKDRLDGWLGESRQRSDFINHAIRAAFDIIDDNLPDD